MKILTSLVIAASLVFASPLARADDGDSGKVAFGPQGGWVWPNFKVDSPNVTTRNFDGFLGGVFVEVGIWALTLRPEINYVEKGYEISNVAKITHKYIEIPALLKFNPLNYVGISPFIVVGPSWSKHIGSKVELLGNTTSYSDNANRWDLAGVGGLGVDFNLGPNFGISAQARYNFGVRDLDDSSSDVKSRGLYGLVGLSFQQ
jgi:hypothetical protein